MNWLLTISQLRYTVPNLVVAAVAAPESPGDEAVDTYREMWSDQWFVRHSIIIGVLLLVLLACFLIRRRKRTLKLFTNDGGAVHVSHLALADLVENTARQYGAMRPRAYFARRGGKMHVWVRMKIAAGQRLPQFSSTQQTRIADALREAFGLHDLGGVHIVITGYTGTPALEEGSPVPYYGAAPAKPAKPPTPPRPDGDYFSGH